MEDPASISGEDRELPEYGESSEFHKQRFHASLDAIPDSLLKAMASPFKVNWAGFYVIFHLVGFIIAKYNQYFR